LGVLPDVGSENAEREATASTRSTAFRIALEAFPTALRPGLLRILTLPDGERAEAIGEMFQEGVTPNLAKLLIDLEEERVLRAMVVGELRRLTRDAE
jgi:hypothetical protein